MKTVDLVKLAEELEQLKDQIADVFTLRKDYDDQPAQAMLCAIANELRDLTAAEKAIGGLPRSKEYSPTLAEYIRYKLKSSVASPIGEATHEYFVATEISKLTLDPSKADGSRMFVHGMAAYVDVTLGGNRTRRVFKGESTLFEKLNGEWVQRSTYHTHRAIWTGANPTPIDMPSTDYKEWVISGKEGETYTFTNLRQGRYKIFDVASCSLPERLGNAEACDRITIKKQGNSWVEAKDTKVRLTGESNPLSVYRVVVQDESFHLNEAAGSNGTRFVLHVEQGTARVYFPEDPRTFVEIRPGFTWIFMKKADRWSVASKFYAPAAHKIDVVGSQEVDLSKLDKVSSFRLSGPEGTRVTFKNPKRQDFWVHSLHGENVLDRAQQQFNIETVVLEKRGDAWALSGVTAIIGDEGWTVVTDMTAFSFDDGAREGAKHVVHVRNGGLSARLNGETLKVDAGASVVFSRNGGRWEYDREFVPRAPFLEIEHSQELSVAYQPYDSFLLKMDDGAVVTFHNPEGKGFWVHSIDAAMVNGHYQCYFKENHVQLKRVRGEWVKTLVSAVVDLDKELPGFAGQQLAYVKPGQLAQWVLPVAKTRDNPVVPKDWPHELIYMLDACDLAVGDVLTIDVPLQVYSSSFVFSLQNCKISATRYFSLAAFAGRKLRFVWSGSDWAVVTT